MKYKFIFEQGYENNPKRAGVVVNSKKKYVKIIYPHGFVSNEELKKKQIDDYKLNDKDKKDIYKIIYCVGKTKQKENELLNINTIDNTNTTLLSYLEILNRYFKNGLYTEMDKQYKQKIGGKINWKRTFATTPYISNGSFVYLDPYYEKKYKVNNIITYINELCVNIAIKNVGWFFGDVETIDCHIDDNKDLYNDYANILERELMFAFNDNKKMLIKNMINILRDTDDIAENGDNEKYVTNNFDKAWELMIEELYGRCDNKDDFLPKGEYHIYNYDKNEYNKSFNSSSLFPDTIALRDDKVFILDSKYYRYGVLNSKQKFLPATDSIHKQIRYGEYAQHQINNEFKNLISAEYKEPDDRIYNAFILPFNKNEKGNSIYFYSGYADGNWMKKDKQDYYERIAVVLVDTRFVMDKYFESSNLTEDELKDLFDNTIVANIKNSFITNVNHENEKPYSTEPVEEEELMVAQPYDIDDVFEDSIIPSSTYAYNPYPTGAIDLDE